MRWFDGSIVNAVALSKSKNAYFVVFVSGSDEKSKLMTQVLNESDIASRLKMDVFVCIKLESNSEAYKQFADIYKLVPVPSLFFIGDNGVPIEIVTSDKASSSSVLKPVLDNLISKKGKSFVSALSNPSSSNEEATGVSASSSFLMAEQENVSKTTDIAPSPVASKPVNIETKKTDEDDMEFETVCEGDVCYRKPKSKDSPESDSGIVTPLTSPSTSSEAMDVDIENKPDSVSKLTIEEKVKHAKDLLEQKRKEKEQKEKEEEKRKEMERRTQGQGVAELKKWQQEQEIKNLREERLKEKKENEKQRAKILQQIAQDRADKQAKFAANNTPAAKPEPTETEPVGPKPVDNSGIARIQFKMADGTSHTTQVSSDSTLGELRKYVKSNIQSLALYSFTLSTMYPRQLLTESKDSETLESLGLCPSSVILVIRGSGSTSGVSSSSSPIANAGFFGMISHLLWSFIVHPAQGVWYWITNFFGGNGSAPRRSSSSTSDQPSTSRENRQFPSEDETGAKKRRMVTKGRSGTTSIRREGNTYRLKDNDSDDENNTWNGNSTQQM